MELQRVIAYSLCKNKLRYILLKVGFQCLEVEAVTVTKNRMILI